MRHSFEQLKTTWAELGRVDPLWAVATREETRGGKWDLHEFCQTGEQDVARYYQLLRTHGFCPSRLNHILDFGCGVGRLSVAWSSRAEFVTGVDISPSMIGKGQALLAGVKNVHLQVNEEPNLKCFPDAEFDLICSHICLQHMAWPIAAGYLREFGRVCRPEGWVAFQLPARQLTVISGSQIRKKLVDLLPFGLDRVYRRWRRGCPVIFEMHYTRPLLVHQTALESGLTELHREPDRSAGESIESFIYLFQKKEAETPT